jgi:tetratricopeptide (TPR) repeat protein
MRRFAAWTGALLILLAPRAGAGPEEAQRAEEAGRWKEAADLWRDAAGNPPDRKYLERSFRALEAAGELDRLLAQAREARSRDPRWDVPALAEAAARAGKGEWREAAAALDGATTPLARARRAGYLDEAGDGEGAGSAYAALVAAYRSSGPKPGPRDLFGYALAAGATGDYEGAAALFERAYRDSLDYLEARLALARLFQSKYQENLATEELTAAEKIAPTHPEFHRAAAEIGLAGFRFGLAETGAEHVLVFRPEDPVGLRVMAFLSLVADRPDEARDKLTRILSARPGDRRARALLAAAAYLDGDTAAWERERDQVLAARPDQLEVFTDLARILELSHRSEEAFALYDQALARNPEHSGALIARGLLLMREGDEKGARAFLEKGFAGDRFNIRAYNQLELLDKMDTFTAYTSPHFEIRLDAAKDSLCVPDVTETLEAVYADLVPQHGYTPPERTIVEVLPSHEWFSARVTGLPWLEGIPAVCFGDVIAMDSPRLMSGQSNWHDVLRHEFGHVLALGMSGKKVPHWFTEGLSVHLERFPRGEWWDQGLAAAYLDNALVPVDSLTIAFTRPRTQDQRLLAYYESGLIVSDLVERKGWDTVPRLLRLFGEGKSLDEALTAVGEDPQAFRRRAMDVVRDAARPIPVWPRFSAGRIARIERTMKDKGRSVEGLGALALAQFQGLEMDRASATAKELLEKDPRSARAHGILGLVAQAAGKGAEAREHLVEAAGLGSADLPVLAALAGMELAAGDSAAALEHYGRMVAIYPLAHEARTMRARILAGQGKTDEAVREYRQVIALNGTAGEAGLELARLEVRGRRGEEALRAVETAAGALPLDANALALKGQALLLLDKDDAAYPLFLRARRLDVRSVETMVGMAALYMKRGDPEEALHFAELALRYDPNHPVALELKARAAGS